MLLLFSADFSVTFSAENTDIFIRSSLSKGASWSELNLFMCAFISRPPMRNKKSRKYVKMLIKSKCWEESQNAVLNLIVENWWRNSPGIIFQLHSLHFVFILSAWRGKKPPHFPLMVGLLLCWSVCPFATISAGFKKKKKNFTASCRVLYWRLFMFCLVHFHYTKSQRKHWAGSVSPSQPSGLPVLY